LRFPGGGEPIAGELYVNPQYGGLGMTGEENIRVILVDDHPVVLDGLALGLSKKPGLEIVGTATDFESGKSLVDASEFDLLVTDLYLSEERDGLELLKRARNAHPKSRFIVLTFSTLPADVLDANAAGADAYLIKDSELDEIAQALRMVASGGRPALPPGLEAVLWEKARGDAQSIGDGKLSQREIEVLRHMANGLKNQEIAATMFLSDRVIRRSNTAIFSKLGVRNRAEAVAKALRGKIV